MKGERQRRSERSLKEGMQSSFRSQLGRYKTMKGGSLALCATRHFLLRQYQAQLKRRAQQVQEELVSLFLSSFMFCMTSSPPVLNP